MAITEEQLEALGTRIVKGFAESLQQARSVSDSVHYDHHRWIAAQIEKEEAWRDLWRDMRVKLITRGVWAVIIGIALALLYAGKEWIQSFVKG